MKTIKLNYLEALGMFIFLITIIFSLFYLIWEDSPTDLMAKIIASSGIVGIIILFVGTNLKNNKPKQL